MSTDAPNATPQAVIIAEMVCRGSTHEEIAAVLGVHRSTISRQIDTPEVQEEIDRITREARKWARQRAMALLGKVSSVWSEALDATAGDLCKKCGTPQPDHAVRLRAADSVADRFGLPKSEVQEVVASLSMAEKADDEIEREVLAEAAAILDRRGKHELANEVRTCS